MDNEIDILNGEELDDYVYFTEMASVAHDWDNGILIAVDPERNTLNIPYFKVYNSSSYEKASRVARLHFKNSGMEYHIRDKKRSIPTWSLNTSDKQKIIDLLRKPYRKNKKYTNWQALCFEWNDVNGLIGNIDIDEYFAGKYDEKYIKHPNSALREAYVPSYQKMPDT